METQNEENIVVETSPEGLVDRDAEDGGADALSTLVDIMKDLDTHYRADDDIQVLRDIGNVSEGIETIIKENSEYVVSVIEVNRDVRALKFI